MKKYWKRTLKTLFLVIIAFSCYYFPKSYEIKEIISECPLIEITRNNNGIVDLLHYVGLFCLVLAVWLWKDLLKINQIGFIGGNEPEPSSPEAVSKSLKVEFDAINSNKIKSTEFLTNRITEQKNAIIQIFESNYANISNVEILSKKLNLPNETIERLLFELQKDGIVRKDIFPGTLKANYSLKKSFVNWSIDKFIKSEIKAPEKFISDIRYFRFENKFDIDAIIETTDFTYIVEVKSINRFIDSNVIERGIKQLLTMEENYKSVKPIKLVLIYTLHKDFNENIESLKDEYTDIKDNLDTYFYKYE
jgi:hypothetical protein